MSDGLVKFSEDLDERQRKDCSLWTTKNWGSEKLSNFDKRVQK